MKIGLIDVDFYGRKNILLNKNFPNLALMKISAWHKRKGDTTELFNIMKQNTYDKIYASKVFSWSKLPFNLPKGTIMGGSGYDVNKKLPYSIEHIYPDYTLYPDMDYAMGYISRGCNNNCEFCIVRKKEGNIKFNAPIEEFWKDQKKMKILDNSIGVCKEAYTELEKIRDLGIKLDITQGFNVRLVTHKFASILSDIKCMTEQWHIAWDWNKDKDVVLKGIDTLIEHGIPKNKLMVYCLVGFEGDFLKDLKRVNTLKNLEIRPYVMQYKDLNSNKKIDLGRKYKLLSDWANFKPMFWKFSFNKYCKLKHRDLIKEEKFEENTLKRIKKLSRY